MKGTTEDGRTPLHSFFDNSLEFDKREFPLEVLHKFVHVRGPEIITIVDKNGSTPMHNHLNQDTPSLVIVQEMNKICGPDIFRMQTTNGMTPIHLHLSRDTPSLVIVQEVGSDEDLWSGYF